MPILSLVFDMKRFSKQFCQHLVRKVAFILSEYDCVCEHVKQMDSPTTGLVNYWIFISQIALQTASRPRMHFDKVFEKAARLIQDGGDGPAVRRE